MRAQKLLSYILAVGTLAILSTMVEAQRVSPELLIKGRSVTSTERAPAPPAATKADSDVAVTDKKIMIGSWLETITFTGNKMPPLKSLNTYTGDGAVIVADQGAVGPEVAFSAGHGSWSHAGGRSFDWTTVELIYSTEDGSLIGYLKVSGRYTVDETGNAYTGPFLASILDPDGNVLDTVGGNNVGHRVQVEPMP